MTGWELPTSLEVGGKDYAIRYQFGAVLDIMTMYTDPELDDSEKVEAMLRIMYPDFDSIPASDIPEAVRKACDFIDCGNRSSEAQRPKLMDWSQDISLIIPAVNGVAHYEVRRDKDLHWWTFWGYFMSIGDSLFSSVLRIRSKRAKHKKLEKHEEEWYRENKHLVDFRRPESEEKKSEKENILKWL